jgi:hypothetical protein
MFETIEAWVGFILVLIFLGTLLACFLMWYAAGLAAIAKSGFWRSLFAAFLASVVSYLFFLAALALNLEFQALYGFAAGLLLSIFIIKGIYATSFFKALVPWIFFLIAQALVIFIATELFIGGLDDLLGIIQ